MKTSVVSVEQIFAITQLPRGTYSGTWSGYEVRVKIHDNSYRLTTKDGIRGIDVPCFVRVFSDATIVEVA